MRDGLVNGVLNAVLGTCVMMSTKTTRGLRQDIPVSSLTCPPMILLRDREEERNLLILIHFLSPLSYTWDDIPLVYMQENKDQEALRGILRQNPKVWPLQRPFPPHP